MSRHILVIGDSLTYHGPDRPHQLDDGRLWPNIMAAELARGAAEPGQPGRRMVQPGPGAAGPGAAGSGLAGSTRGPVESSIAWDPDIKVDLVARLGWTARDAWWAVTKDPRLWGRVLPRADALVLAVGGMDHLPASIPTYLRDGIPYVSPAPLRRRVRQVYRSLSPLAIKATGGWLRQVPQRATDQYLARIAQAVRHFNPTAPVVLLAPSPYDSPAYPSDRHHRGAVAAAHQWGETHGAAVIAVDECVRASLLDGTANPDGLHWSWHTHEQVGRLVATTLAPWSRNSPVEVPSKSQAI